MINLCSTVFLLYIVLRKQQPGIICLTTAFFLFKFVLKANVHIKLHNYNQYLHTSITKQRLYLDNQKRYIIKTSIYYFKKNNNLLKLLQF